MKTIVMYNVFMNKISPMDKLKDANPKYACIARGMMDYFLGGYEDSNKLRACQEFAYEYAVELGADVTTKTASPVGKLLRDAGVFQQLPRVVPRNGHTLIPGPTFDEFVEFLETSEFGTRIKGSKNDDLARSAVFEFLDEYGSIRANQEHLLPKVEYAALRKALNAGTMDIIFVRPGTVVGVKHDGETKRARFYA